MKKEWLITFRSVTFAQRGQRALHRRKIECRLQRTPKQLSQRGCGYCLHLRGWDAPTAIEILEGEQIPFEKLYAIMDDGTAQERVL